MHKHKKHKKTLTDTYRPLLLKIKVFKLLVYSEPNSTQSRFTILRAGLDIFQWDLMLNAKSSRWHGYIAPITWTYFH